MGDRVETLRWRTGAIGCLFPLLVVTALLLGAAAFIPDLAGDLSNSRRGHLIAWTSAVSVGGINVPLALLALYLLWECFRFGWRWADEVAVSATSEGLNPHSSLLMKPIPWRDVKDIRFGQVGRATALLIKFRNGRSRAVKGVEIEGESARRFLDFARARVSGASS